MFESKYMYINTFNKQTDGRTDIAKHKLRILPGPRIIHVGVECLNIVHK